MTGGIVGSFPGIAKYGWEGRGILLAPERRKGGNIKGNLDYMSRIKADLTRLSLNQLSTLTGKTSRTLKKLLANLPPEEESGTLYYRPVEALPQIYGLGYFDVNRDLPAGEHGDDFEDGRLPDPIREKARLDRRRADKLEIEIDVMKKKLIPIESVESAWSQMAGAFRSKIMNLPRKVAPRICATKDMRAIEKILSDECNEALTELSEYGDGFSRAKSNKAGSQTPRAST